MKYTVRYFITLLKKSQYLRAYFFTVKKIYDYGGVLPFVAVVLTVVNVLLEILLTYLTALLVSSFVGSILLTDFSLLNLLKNNTFLYAVGILGIWLLRRGILYLIAIIENDFFNKRFNRFHEELAEKFSMFNLEDIEVFPVYDTISKIRNFWYLKFQEFYLEMKSIVSSFVGAISVGIIIVNYSLTLSGVILLSVLPIVISNIWVTNKHRKMVDRTTPIRNRRDYTLETILSNRNVAEKKVDMIFSKLLKGFTRDNNYLAKEHIEQGFFASFWSFFAEVLSFLVISVVRLRMIVLIIAGKIELTLGLSLFNYVMFFWEKLAIFSQDIVDLTLIGNYLSYYYQYVSIPTMHEKSIGKKSIARKIETLSVNDLSFAYPKTNGNVIKNLNFEINRGERVLILGKDGSGKSSITKILTGLFRLYSGDVQINGISLKDVKPGVWKKNFSVVFDDFGRFFYSVKDCVILADERNVFDRRRYALAIEITGIDKLFSSGIISENQLLGSMFEGGVEIPSGFWQRIAIARAIYRDRPIQIFDEAFSMIDSSTSRKIMNNLIKYWDNKIVLMIDENDQFVKYFDNVYILHKGGLMDCANSDILSKW